MPFPCGLSVVCSQDITVEAATLLALTLLIATSLIITASMARKRSNKSGSTATRPPLVPGQPQTAGEPPASVAGSDSPVPAAIPPPAPKQTDSRPVAS